MRVGGPKALQRFTLALVGAATLALAIARDIDIPPGTLRAPELWILVGLTLAGELLPIRVARRGTYHHVTVSGAFALAILLRYGALPAMVSWGMATLVADAVTRLPAAKIAFNAAEYVLSMGAAALALHAAGGTPPLPAATGSLPPILAASVALLSVNYGLPVIGVALATSTPVSALLRRDLIFQGWTGGLQLAMAPLLLGVDGPVLALGALPVLAIYLGGRQAAAAAHRATHDELTGLPNGVGLRDALELGFAGERHDGRDLFLVVVALEGFPSTADTLGSQWASSFLQAVAARVVDAARPQDVVARLSTDSFAVLARLAGEPAAGALSERVLAALARPVTVHGISVEVVPRIGVAGSDGGEGDPEELVRRAQIAVERARETHRSVVFHSGERADALIDRIALARALRGALDRRQLAVHFQVKVPMVEGLPPAVEALVRWQHPELGVVSPPTFVSLAEETGMIRDLTVQVLDGALRQCHDWRRRGRPVRVGVNLSAKSLVDSSLAATISDLLLRHELPGHALQLELTESAALADVPRARVALGELRELGVTLAIDDFGTGFSSLAQLQQLPLEEIKIDRSFVLAMPSDPHAAVIVRSIVNLARSLELRVTAEGVENVVMLRELQALGCDYAQGYLFGKAAPGPAAESLLWLGPTEARRLGQTTGARG